MSELLNKEAADLIRELNAIGDNAKRSAGIILVKAARQVVNAIFVAAPHGKRIHKRYNTVKLVKGWKAKKGMGRVVATYYPGNLASSFDVLRFRRSRYAVFVGPKLAKGISSGVFGPFGKADGYYATMVEGGTKYTPPRPFVEPTWNAMKETTRQRIVNALKEKIKRLKKV